MKVQLVYCGVGVAGFCADRPKGDREGSWIGHGIASIGASTKAAGHDVSLIDLRQMGGAEDLTAKLRDCEADVFGLSVSPVDAQHAPAIAKIIRHFHPKSKIIIGGIHPTLFPDRYDTPEIDTVVVGEGEVTFPDLVCLHELGETLPKVIRGKKPDLDCIPWVDRELFDYQRELDCYFAPGQELPSITMLAGRGCPFKCSYCLDGETLVMMADYSHKKIKDIKVGDSIVGLNKKKRGHEVVITSVKNHFSRIAETYLVQTDRGYFKATGEHPFLAYSNHSRWRLVKNLKVGDKIHHICKTNHTEESVEYKKGYVAGVVSGDGYTGKYTRKRNKNEVYYNVRVAGDYEMLDVFAGYCKDIGINVHHHKFNGGKIFYNLNRAVGGYSKKTYDSITSLLTRKNTSRDFRVGFLAGMMDADGTNSSHTIRYCGIDKELMNKVELYLSGFGFKVVHEKNGIRLIGDSSVRNSLISLIRPKVPKKKRMLFGNSKATVLKITKLKEQKVYNISTGTENFIANGFASHNCQPAENAVFGHPYRMRSPGNVVAELRHLKAKHGFKSITFWDDTFTLNKSWIMKFCDMYEREKFGATIAACSRADIICRNEEMVERLASVGCDWFVIGMESGSQRVLNFLKKGTTVEQNIEAARICRKYGIKVFATFMFGLPTETKAEALATALMIDKIAPDFPSAFYFTPIEGTEIYDACLANDLILEGAKNRTISRTGVFEPTIKGVDYTFLDRLRTKEGFEARKSLRQNADKLRSVMDGTYQAAKEA